MAKPLTTHEERVAVFQQLFSDSIPHSKALGLKVLAIARGLDARYVCLYGADRLRFGTADLRAVHSEPEARCFLLPDGAGGAGP